MKDNTSEINLCFVNTTKTWGGGERWHYENAVYASENGFNVSLICAKDSVLKDKAREAGLKVFSVNLSNTDFLNPEKQSRLVRFFKKSSTDVVVFNGSKDLKAVGPAALKTGVGLRIYRRGLAKAPHSGIYNRFLFKNVITDFIVNSRETEKLLFSSKSLNQYKKNVHLIYNGLEPHDNWSEKKSADKIILGNASRFVEQKGLHYLIELADNLKNINEDFKLIIAGDGPLEKELKSEVLKRKLNDFVEFPGFVKDIKNFVAGLDIYICSSVFEGFGFSIAEAMHAGRPVVGFNVSSNPELIINNENGFLVDAFDTNKLTDKVLTLMKDENLRIKMGESGRKSALEKFNKNIQQKTFCDMIKTRINEISNN